MVCLGGVPCLGCRVWDLGFSFYPNSNPANLNPDPTTPKPNSSSPNPETTQQVWMLGPVRACQLVHVRACGRRHSCARRPPQHRSGETLNSARPVHLIITMIKWIRTTNPEPGIDQVIDSGMVGAGSGAARAEDAQGTPAQSHISPSIL